MNFLQEALRDFRRLDAKKPHSPNDEQEGEDLDLDLDDEKQTENSSEDDLSLDTDEQHQDREGSDQDQQLDSVADQATEDPDHQGLIRQVKGAHLVYKRKTEDGLFSELWIYNVDQLRHEFDIKKAILAGTDIPTNKTSSPDGSQSYTIWSAGNAELILIMGLVQ